MVTIDGHDRNQNLSHVMSDLVTIGWMRFVCVKSSVNLGKRDQGFKLLGSEVIKIFVFC